MFFKLRYNAISTFPPFQGSFLLQFGWANTSNMTKHRRAASPFLGRSVTWVTAEKEPWHGSDLDLRESWPLKSLKSSKNCHGGHHHNTNLSVFMIPMDTLSPPPDWHETRSDSVTFTNFSRFLYIPVLFSGFLFLGFFTESSEESENTVRVSDRPL